MSDHEEQEGGTNTAAAAGTSPGGGGRPEATTTTTTDKFVEGVSCSGHSSSRPRHVRFVNTTAKTVDLIWLDHEGKRVLYRSMSPQTAHSVRTYEKHPWIFRDGDESLVIEKYRGVKGEYFESDDYLRSLSDCPDYSAEQRLALADGKAIICVMITLPVEDLRHLALRTVRKRLAKKEDAFCIEVPQAVQFELAQMF